MVTPTRSGASRASQAIRCTLVGHGRQRARSLSLADAPPQTWVDNGGATMTYDPPNNGENAIERVGILIDKSCSDSCEQLVLDLCQSTNVTVWGERSQGL